MRPGGQFFLSPGGQFNVSSDTDQGFTTHERVAVGRDLWLVMQLKPLALIQRRAQFGKQAHAILGGRLHLARKKAPVLVAGLLCVTEGQIRSLQEFDSPARGGR